MNTVAPAAPEPTVAEPTVGLSATAMGRELPDARARARRRPDPGDRFVGWAASIAVALLALFLRLWRLGSPRSFAFDETYYAKDAWSMLQVGYARDTPDGANDLILHGTLTGPDVFKDTPSMVVHPDLGKWMIALGERAFGMEPFGWRISAAVFGALTVLVMCRLARRLTGSTLLGCIAGLLLCFDGIHLVLSRLALLDVFLAFWLVCATACLVADRDWFRHRLADRMTSSGFGPVLLFRPWLLGAGICFGLAAGVKWTAVYPLAAFGILVFAWSAGARNMFGVRSAWLRSALIDGPIAFVSLVLVAVVVYTATWTGWLMNASVYEKALSNNTYTQQRHAPQWPSATEPDADGFGEVVQSLRSLWSYHQDVYYFHTHGLNESTHTYQSAPSGWLLLNRPVGVDYQGDIQPGDRGCQAAPDDYCVKQVLILGTPALWWGACLALAYALVMWIGARDWRAGVAVTGALSTWLPWLMYDDRPIFIFYASAILPFLVLALTLVIGRIIGTDTVPTRRRTVGVILAGSYLMLVLINFAYFWPIWTDQLITHREWLGRIWFQHWI